MRIVLIVLTLGLAGCAYALAQTGADEAKIADFVKTLPSAKPPEYAETVRLYLASNPLGCEEHLENTSGGLGGLRVGYLWQRGDSKPQLPAEYDHTHAFYGCFDWHSAVNSTWMMVNLLKNDPSIPVAQPIRDDLEYRLEKSNIDGEIKFFNNLAGPGANFEKPYGYAWILKLYGELKSWDDPEGKRGAAVLEPMEVLFNKEFTDYLNSLNYPIRIGLHPNTALDMNFVLDYVEQTNDAAMKKTIHDNAMRLFANDKHCPTQMEPVFGEFASPCLTEAALMSRVMAPADYAKWLDDFLPPVYSEDFSVYSKDIDAEHGDNRDTTGTDEEGLPNSHLIGLNFQRAACLVRIARGLPPDDPRIPAYLKLSQMASKAGFAKMGQGGYLVTHWISTYALMYENVAEQQKPAAARASSQGN
jgi:Protein of unknown function (DUF2891)